MILTKEQRKALYRKYLQDPDGAKSYRDFRRRVGIGFGDEYIIIPWCGMYVGIERDGYAHT